MEDQRDEHLWEIARRRARFHDKLARYVVLIILLWGIWGLTGERYHHQERIPWPAWPTFFLGVLLIMHYIKAYKTDDKTITEREYEKLKRQNP